MESINPMGGMQPAGLSRRVAQTYRMNTPATPVPADSVQLSDVMRLRGVDGIRFEKVMAIRGAMEAGTYMTPEKMDVALDRALDAALASVFPNGAPPA